MGMEIRWRGFFEAYIEEGGLNVNDRMSIH